MTSAEKTPSQNRVQRKYCRCPVVAEETRAFLVVGRKRYRAMLYDRSIGGFSILLKASDAQKLRLGEIWQLQTTSEKTHVVARWLDKCADGCVHMGLQRLDDFNRSNASGPFPIWLGKRRRTRRPELLVAAIVFLAISIFAIPAVRERVGMNPHVQAALNLLQSSMQGDAKADGVNPSI